MSMIVEESEIRYHVGYCLCGRRIVVGNNRAQELVNMLVKKGMAPKKRTPWKIRLARRWMKSYQQGELI